MAIFRSSHIANAKTVSPHVAKNQQVVVANAYLRDLMPWDEFAVGSQSARWWSTWGRGSKSVKNVSMRAKYSVSV
jgi:hypothetical protein